MSYVMIVLCESSEERGSVDRLCGDGPTYVDCYFYGDAVLFGLPTMFFDTTPNTVYSQFSYMPQW